MKKMKVLCTAAVITLIMTACATDTGSNDTSSSTSTAATGTNPAGRATSIASSSASEADTDKFTTVEEANNGYLTVICDNTTGVEYIVFTSPINGAIAVTPRLNRDGKLVIKK